VRGALVVFLVAFLIIGICAFDPPTNPLDEFLPLVCAQRVLAGEVPYRDYTTLYPPLTTLVDAALLGAFPRSVLLARFVFVGIAVIGLVLVKSIATRLSGSDRAGTLAGLLAALCHGAPHWGYALSLATVLLLGALRALLQGKRRATVLAGVLLGLASLTRHDAAFYAAFPLGLLAFSRSRRELAWFLGVAALFPLGFFVFLLMTGALPQAWEQLVVIPATLYPKIRGLPFPPPWRGPADADVHPSLASIYGPFLVSGLALARSRGERAKQAAALLPFALGVTALVRTDHAHAYGASLASFAALGVLAHASKKEIALVLALLLPGAGLQVLESARIARHVFRKNPVFATRSPRTHLLYTGGIDGHRAHALDAVAALPSEARIFVALPRHDRIWINDVAFYFDSGRLPATRHHELYALVATTPEVQQEIVRDLERSRPPLVVVSSVRPAWEPNASHETFDTHVLDEYLAKSYEVDFVDGHYTVLRRAR
jgi:hypothetical protein